MSRTPSVRKLCLAALSACALFGVAASAVGAPNPDAIQPDPNIRRGTLPNGLQYAVLSHAEPKGGAGTSVLNLR